MSEAGTCSRTSILRPLQGQLVTLRELAVRRRLSVYQLREQAAAGDLPGAFKTGRFWRVHADVAEAVSSGWWDPEQEQWADFAARHGLTETRWV